MLKICRCRYLNQLMLYDYWLAQLVTIVSTRLEEVGMGSIPTAAATANHIVLTLVTTTSDLSLWNVGMG